MLDLTLSNSAESSIRVLCLGAHCDDIEIGCGGTILTLLERYGEVRVDWVVFSSSAGRAIEARESADIFLEASFENRVVVKSYRDGFFPYDGAQIKDDFEALKNSPSPDLILTHHRDDRHQDHRVISDLTWNTFRNHLILEYEIPKYDGDLGHPNFFVPLEERVCSKKIDTILKCFRSQGRKQWFDKPTFMAVLRLRGVESNSPTHYAEAFHCRKALLS
ncbi:MAG: PIG-L deacetylase family protein [Thermoanaerobaculia bacterium]